MTLHIPNRKHLQARARNEAEHIRREQQRRFAFKMSILGALNGMHVSRISPAWPRFNPDIFDGLGRYIARIHPRFADRDLTSFFLGDYPSPFELDAVNGTIRFKDPPPAGTVEVTYGDDPKGGYTLHAEFKVP